MDFTEPLTGEQREWLLRTPLTLRRISFCPEDAASSTLLHRRAACSPPTVAAKLAHSPARRLPCPDRMALRHGRPSVGWHWRIDTLSGTGAGCLHATRMAYVRELVFAHRANTTSVTWCCDHAIIRRDSLTSSASSRILYMMSGSVSSVHPKSSS